jgi:hypothetical protein
VPHDPLAQIMPPAVPQLAPAAAQRVVPKLLTDCTQQPPSLQVLPGQQG